MFIPAVCASAGVQGDTPPPPPPGTVVVVVVVKVGGGGGGGDVCGEDGDALGRDEVLAGLEAREGPPGARPQLLCLLRIQHSRPASTPNHSACQLHMKQSTWAGRAAEGHRAAEQSGAEGQRGSCDGILVAQLTSRAGKHGLHERRGRNAEAVMVLLCATWNVLPGGAENLALNPSCLVGNSVTESCALCACGGCRAMVGSIGGALAAAAKEGGGKGDSTCRPPGR